MNDMTRPQQAVILCGGLGTRLRPLTDALPKALAPVQGRPFLSFLIEQLHEQRISRVVLLIGYLGGLIRDAFGDGSQYGVRIDYSAGPAEWETGRRIYEARHLLDDRFLLLYSDNYVPVSVDKLGAAHADRDTAVTLLLQPKKTGNIRLGPEGRIELYDPSRTASGLDYVEIGYMVVQRDAALAELVEPNVSFSHVLQRLTAQGRAAGLVSRDPYHSISDNARWSLADRYFATKRIVLLDRDGTINERPPAGEYVGSWGGFRWIDRTVDALRRLAQRGFRFIVLSNQAGIARGVIDVRRVDEINARMVTELASMGVEVMAVYVCPHHWDDKCECRKPEPGLLFRASRDHLLRMDRTMYIGDDPRDSRAAFNAECLSILIGPERDTDPGGGARPAFSCETLPEAVPWIVSRFETWERVMPPSLTPAEHGHHNALAT